jgi:inosine-uridine nucleoside N-ribohydrolase
MHPKELTVIVLGPATMLTRAFDRDPELPRLLDSIVMMGGTWHEPGNATATAEFHFFCDPAAARRVLHSGVPLKLIPLDVTRKLIFSPTDLLELPAPDSMTCKFLRQIVPFGIRASSNLYGIEGFHLKDVLGIADVALDGVVQTHFVYADVEQRGELTRGMLVVDSRPRPAKSPNVRLGVNVDTAPVREYIRRSLENG